jgi:hypothetical protein
LAQSDLESLKREGISDNSINKLSKQFNITGESPKSPSSTSAAPAYRGTGTQEDPIKLD